MPIPEGLLLIAVWIYVPFGLDRVVPGVADSRLRTWTRWLWLPGALGATAALLLHKGGWAALAALPYLLFAGLLGLSALLRLRATWRSLTLPGLLRIGALAQLPVGAGWLLLSRWGMEPLGFKEPIVVLTGVHFHFAGFLAPILVAEVAERLGLGTRPLLTRGHKHPETLGFLASVVRWGGLGLLLGTPALAAGFVLAPALQAGAALTITLSLSAVGLCALARLRHAPRPVPLALSWLCVLAGMGLAAIYAIGEYTGAWWLNMAEMALTHGLLNGLGFALFGVVAWHGTPHEGSP